MSEKIVQLNEEVIKGQIKELVRGSVEETLNELLEQEAEKLTQAARYERSEARQGYVLDEDNITEDAPYWYLTVLAAKCSARRMVPDYISAKVMKQLKGDVYSCMGCRAFLTPDTEGLNPDDSHKYYGRFNQGVVMSIPAWCHSP